MPEPLMYESHSHTPLCKHAEGLPQEYAASAFAQGFRGLIVTCHNPMPDGFSANVRMRLDEFDEYQRLVEQARQDWQGRIDVRLGLEADYFPGHESFLEKQLTSAEFHYVLGSVHPQIAEFRRSFWSDDPLAVQRKYFSLLADSAETGLFDCLAHPDLIKNETKRDWQPERIMDDICAALDRIAATGVAMELNTSGVNKLIAEMNPFPAMLVEMQARSIPVVLGADAHVPHRVGDGYLAAFDLLESCGYEQISLFSHRRRRDIPIAAARRSITFRADVRDTPRPTLANDSGARHATTPLGGPA